MLPSSLPSLLCICSRVQVVYAWSTSTPAWINTVVPSGYSQKALIIPGPVPLATDGGSYFATLTARFADSNNTNNTVTIPITLSAVGSPLIAQLRAPSGDVKNTSTIRLDSSQSSDPDDPANFSPMVYEWSCARVGSLAPCVNGVLGSRAGSAWSIPISSLEVGAQYVLTLTVKKGARWCWLARAADDACASPQLVCLDCC